MTSRIDKVNRFLLWLIGLICLAGGVVILLLSFRAFGKSAARHPLLQPGTRSFAHHNAWLWVAIAAGAVLLFLLALRWLRAQLSTAGVRELDVDPDSTLGSSKVSAGGLTEALEDEVSRYRGVDDVRARIFGASSRPHLRLDVALKETADLGAVRTKVESEALHNVLTATGRDDMRSLVRLEIAERHRRNPA